jgi:thiol-disulfide isomerase/thioredoxin
VRRAVAALLVLVAAAACGGGSKKPSGVDLQPLRAAAALQPCPRGVGDVPALTLPCLGGGPDVRLDAGPSGVPTLVNIYGSWCGPCQKEMPVLASFARRAGSAVALLGVDTEDEQRLALLFARDVGQHWPAVVDDDGTLLRHYAPGPPATLFVDRAGKVVFVHRGAFSSLTQLVAQVRTHLGVSV